MLLTKVNSVTFKLYYGFRYVDFDVRRSLRRCRRGRGRRLWTLGLRIGTVLNLFRLLDLLVLLGLRLECISLTTKTRGGGT
ncbi:hypothetical protein L1987_01124 [Smallanthus sonchifolius]|uniref:Uncharacterized protein n=1 Tax=Smallanthus sonchifolius TaxID=185202 RepID=A0ACB9K479_9ASTR|nr:hypothetical protein L1987_01124 [Smallanthus sonchifolius]